MRTIGNLSDATRGERTDAPTLRLPIVERPASQMRFTVAVRSAGRRPFSIEVDGDKVTSLVLTGLIERSESGRRIGYAAVDWLLFPATEDGKKMGSDPFGDIVDIAPPPGTSLMNVWVEPMAPATAGEAFAP